MYVIRVCVFSLFVLILIIFFSQIVMSNLRGESTTQDIYGPYEYEYDQGIDEPMRGFNDPDYDMWEEWMGWEGAGIRDYSSHINPYI